MTDYGQLDETIAFALENTGDSPGTIWRKCCELFPDVHSRDIAERIAAAMIDLDMVDPGGIPSHELHDHGDAALTGLRLKRNEER